MTTEPKEAARRTVWVQSVQRQNYGGSYRIGRYWTSAEPTEAEVTEAELKMLVEDPLLHVFDQKPRKLRAHAEPPEVSAGEVVVQEPKAAPHADAGRQHKR